LRLGEKTHALLADKRIGWKCIDKYSH